MKARRYILESKSHLNISDNNKVFDSIEAATPEGYTVAQYGYDTLVIIPKGHDFKAERYGEIGYIYTGQIA